MTTAAPIPASTEAGAAPDGTVWLVAGHPGVYHVLDCLPVQGARKNDVVIEVDVDGPETLAGRVMCHACARRLGHGSWDPVTATGTPAR